MRRLIVPLLLALLLLLPALARGQPAPPPPSVLLNQPNTWTKPQTYGNATNVGTITIDGATATQRPLRFSTSGSLRWQLFTQNNAETVGPNQGSSLWIRAHSDTGATIGSLLQATRGSGPYGTGAPYFDVFSPFQQLTPRATTPGGVAGNLIDFTSGMDVEPVTTLLANPISTTQGNRNVTVAWIGCCKNGGPLYSVTRETWVKMSNVAPFAGTTMDGWYKTTTVNNDSFTVLVATPPNATASGMGGSTVTAQPSFITQGSKTVYNVTTGVNGFPDGRTYYYAANPLFYSTTGSGPRYQADFTQVYTPNDTTDNNLWGTVGHEINYINRGNDYGYSPIAYGAKHNMVGLWLGPLPGAVTVVPGGGTGANWPIILGCFSNFGQVGIYNCANVQPDALVGQANDPTGHGGVGYDVFGSYDPLPSNPFGTTSGSNLITVTTQGYAGDYQSDGATVYLPDVLTINGVTFGGGTYVTSATDHAGNTFKITGTGTATATGNGGGLGRWMAFLALVPYAPFQTAGWFAHGFSATKQSRFTDGLIVNAPPGAGIGWTEDPAAADVTQPTTASVTGEVTSPGNINVLLTAAGTGVLRAASPLRLKPLTVATLPPCGAINEGALVYVTDATAPAYNAALTGGGAVRVPAFCNGTAWTAH